MTSIKPPVPDSLRCCATTKKGERCKRPRMPGYDQCDTHGYTRKYFIQFQWRREVPKGPRHDWRSWRHFAVWPILFDTPEAARDHMNSVNIFTNFGGRRKASASVGRTARAFLTANRRG